MTSVTGGPGAVGVDRVAAVATFVIPANDAHNTRNTKEGTCES